MSPGERAAVAWAAGLFTAHSAGAVERGTSGPLPF
jgi:hypothetical protein